MNLLVLGLVAGIVYYFSQQGKAAATQIDFSPKRLAFVSINPFNFTVDLFLQIQNNSAAVVNIQSLDGRIILSGAQAGTFAVKNAFQIPAYSNVTVQTRVIVYNTEIVKILLDTLKSNTTPKVDFEGIIHTTLGQFGFKYNALLEKNLNFKKQGGSV